jgi:hypothetical protein
MLLSSEISQFQAQLQSPKQLRLTTLKALHPHIKAHQLQQRPWFYIQVPQHNADDLHVDVQRMHHTQGALFVEKNPNPTYRYTTPNRNDLDQALAIEKTFFVQRLPKRTLEEVPVLSLDNRPLGTLLWVKG